jgi:transcriptional repressor NrdR
VVKRSGIREPYIRDKLRAGISRACAKTTVTAEQIDDLVDSVENELLASGRREVAASMLGEIGLRLLSNLDQVAYVRFASVYRQFRSIEDFIAELNLLRSEQTVRKDGSDRLDVVAPPVVLRGGKGGST